MARQPPPPQICANHKNLEQVQKVLKGGPLLFFAHFWGGAPSSRECEKLAWLVKLYTTPQSIDHCFVPPFLSQWWANIIKWTQTNIRIYSDATLCTEQISEYIWKQHIYRTNIQIYLYSGNIKNTNMNNIRKSLYLNIRVILYSSLIK